MLAGMSRFVCQNGLVVRRRLRRRRVPHKGNVTDLVIEGAYEVLHGSENRCRTSRDAMRAITLDDGEAASASRPRPQVRRTRKILPITESQILHPRRFDDNHADLRSTFNRPGEPSKAA